MPPTNKEEQPPNGAGEEREISPDTLYKVRSGALIGIFILAILYTAYFAAPILIPMALAFLLSMILAPIVGWLERFHIPTMLGAAVVLVVLLTGIGAGVYGLSKPAIHWIKEAPHAVKKLERTFHSINGPFHEIQETKQKVESMSSDNSTPGPAPKPVKVVNQSPGVMGHMASVAPTVLTGDSFLRSLAHVVPRWSDKKRVVEIARGIQHHISRYLLTITLINLCLGLVDGLVLWAIGIPNPLLWGVMIAIFNYVPYIGAATAIGVLTLIALVTFSHIGMILLVPGVVLAVAILEGQFVTPHVVGRRLVLSPVAVFIALVVSGWIWGIAGAIMAVPLLASFKIMCEEIEALNPIAEFLTVYSLGNGRSVRNGDGDD